MEKSGNLKLQSQKEFLLYEKGDNLGKLLSYQIIIKIYKLFQDKWTILRLAFQSTPLGNSYSAFPFTFQNSL